jgi:Ca2+-binding RTX toxin-like protein
VSCRVLCLGAAPASASTVGYDALSDTLTFMAAPGETNNATVQMWLGAVVVIDAAAAVVPGAGCAQSADGILCTTPAAGSTRIVIDAGDQADRMHVVNYGAPACGPVELRGGAGNDRLFGLDERGCPMTQTIDGGAGDDRIESGADADDVRGGDGYDTIDYTRSPGPVLIDLGSGDAVSGLPGEGDRLTGFEAGLGTASDDYLIGTGGPNLLDGGPGDDLIDGGPGADTLAGGEGDDILDYGIRTEPLTVYLDGSKPSGGASDGTGDVIRAVENVWSGGGNDTLVGDGQDNLLNGGYGADLLVGGGGDDLDDYSERTEAVAVTLEDAPTSGSAGDGQLGARDTLREIENLYGGDGNDVLTGNGEPNFIDGGDGDDAIDVYDGVLDEVDCGLGTGDQAKGDLADVAVGTNCETFVRSSFNVPVKVQPPVAQSPPVIPRVPVPALGLTLRLGKSTKLALSKGFAVTGTCNRACRLRAELKLNKQAARRLGLRSATTIATGSAAKSGKVTLKFTSAAKRALKKARQVKATLMITATGTDGKVAVVRRTMTLKR